MLLDSIVETFGPFLIPAVLFLVGFIGYIVLILLTRYGVLPGRSPPEDDEN